MKCIIIEDQPPAQRILKKYIADVGTLSLQGVFSDALQAMEFLKSHDVDLIFLDIHLPKISGIDFLKSLPNPPKVILTTAFPDYALEGYELNVTDYLLKPFSFQRFVQAISKVILPQDSGNSSQPANPASLPPNELFIKSGHSFVKVEIPEIFYIQSDADYTELVTLEKKHLSAEPLRYWEEKLNSDQFIRVHKSYIINLAKVEKISSNQVYLTNDTKIPIGRAYKEAFMKRFLS